MLSMLIRSRSNSSATGSTMALSLASGTLPNPASSTVLKEEWCAASTDRLSRTGYHTLRSGRRRPDHDWQSGQGSSPFEFQRAERCLRRLTALLGESDRDGLGLPSMCELHDRRADRRGHSWHRDRVL